MTKTAKQAIMDYFGVTLVPESLLKELEAIMQGVIGHDTPINPTALFVLQAEKLAQNELRKHQRNSMRSALYGEEKK